MACRQNCLIFFSCVDDSIWKVGIWPTSSLLLWLKTCVLHIYIYNAGQLTFSQFTLRQARLIPTCMKNSFGLPFREGHWVSEKCSIKVSISNMPSLTPKIESHCRCIVLSFRRWPWEDTTMTKLAWPLWSIALTGISKRFQMRRGRRKVIMRARWEDQKENKNP